MTFCALSIILLIFVKKLNYSIATALQYSKIPEGNEFAKNVSNNNYRLIIKSLIIWTHWASKRAG
ncbi:hypothetical protein FACS189452_02220 [Bacteroidia bacterium]|nr:hypothetical protein FACS189452_02220 [Bacteroidia bacterium]GHT79977.1 hypothetical protein FACS189467_0840 [Bacteroidia bacterium]